MNRHHELPRRYLPSTVGVACEDEAGSGKDDIALTQKATSIADLLAMPEAADVDFEPPRLRNGAYRPVVLA